jgi:hypothetical protein
VREQRHLILLVFAITHVQPGGGAKSKAVFHIPALIAILLRDENIIMTTPQSGKIPFS